MTLLNILIVLITLPLVGILLLGAFRFYVEGVRELKKVPARVQISSGETG